jgi:hypothetical protein
MPDDGSNERGVARGSRRTPTLVVSAALLLLLGSGCTHTAPHSGPRVGVIVQDFRIRTAARTVSAGTVVFHISNKGPSTHELVVVRTDLPADGLPITADGLSIDEESPKLRGIGEDPDLDIGASKDLVLRLRPGRYVLFCNLEGHYLGGMHAPLIAG